MKTAIIIFSIMMIFCGCNKDSAEDLMLVDREFSAMSAEEGMKTAFLDFADQNAVIFPQNSMPVVGKEAIAESYNAFSDEVFILTWEPLSADISKSGDLGYTYGLYTMFVKADSSTSRGKYVSIWKKQDDGSWKWVLDAGNEGLGQE